MNKSLRQLFIAVLVLFLVITCSTFFWSIIYAPSLDANPENTVAFYHEVGMDRGEILSSGGEILAESRKSGDSFNYQRSYPEGAAFAPVTGFFSVATPPSRGVEMGYDKVLSGGAGSVWQQKFESIFDGQEEGEVDVETNIEAPLQEEAYSLLKGKSGAVVALDPKTGAILALASSPTYDPNLLAVHDPKEAESLYSSYSQDGSLTDLATQYLLSPGSTFNILTSAVALQKGMAPSAQVQAPTTFKLPSGMVVANRVYYPLYTIRSQMPLSSAFSHSSSTAFAILAQKFGAKALEDEAAAFGMGGPLRICGGGKEGSPVLSAASSLGDVGDEE
ncbi:MAG: penicillin-binding protein 2, partial [Aeriscardovia sp.]|nr:penicillin-binding protein 2 [Aeriscardovia sp.]